MKIRRIFVINSALHTPHFTLYCKIDNFTITYKNTRQGEIIMGPFIIFLIAIIIVAVIANIKVVPQAHAYVIERLGTYHVTWSTGLHVKIPFIDKISKKVNYK